MWTVEWLGGTIAQVGVRRSATSVWVELGQGSGIKLD